LETKSERLLVGGSGKPEAGGASCATLSVPGNQSGKIAEIARLNGGSSVGPLALSVVDRQQFREETRRS
jgi:hypothetical protein